MSKKRSKQINETTEGEAVAGKGDAPRLLQNRVSEILMHGEVGGRSLLGEDVHSQPSHRWPREDR